MSPVGDPEGEVIEELNAAVDLRAVGSSSTAPRGLVADNGEPKRAAESFMDQHVTHCRHRRIRKVADLLRAKTKWHVCFAPGEAKVDHIRCASPDVASGYFALFYAISSAAAVAYAQTSGSSSTSGSGTGSSSSRGSTPRAGARSPLRHLIMSGPDPRFFMSAYYLRGGWKKSRMVDPPHPAGSAADAGLAPPTVVEADDEPPPCEASELRLV